MSEEEKKAIEYWRHHMILLHWNIQLTSEYYLKVLLDLVEKLQKENEKLKRDNGEYELILDIWDNRTYRKKYLEERRAEQPNLLYPDGDEIYERYYELKEENEKLKKSRKI